ncbi:malectin domain-containing carbohydrate-binding protein [Cytophaga sp. FL35]|uniref:malectin domain-containing carbohydrate-binding protein n=1 Tax=Cytophaga sp. FL35 TaxID=1904456 RepID=UPI001653DEFE|nr:malectin domain-containing carbohydrate-binding protein [Cytophaga sp. FL35]MBC6998146.1 DUF4038 domain-containing protein [Cytophaga sp. FL35]
MTNLLSNVYIRIVCVVLCSFKAINLSGQVSNERARVMEVVEVTFNSENTYNNPYTDVDVWVELKKSGQPQETYRVPVFWDGDNIFRVRLVATSPGEWTWRVIDSTITNEDRGFVGKTGSFVADPAEVQNNPNNRGFIRVASNNRTLEYADGTPFFYTADTSWSALTAVFGFDMANSISGISFKDYIAERKRQGFNGLNVIASFPDDTYLMQQGRNLDRRGTSTGLWSSATWGKKVAPNGATPFEMKKSGQPVTDASLEVDYRRIVPEYWQAVDERMQFLSDQGFVTLFESVRRHERWPFRAQEEKNAFYNYIRYLWARYGCYNMIFSWVHHDTNSGNVYPGWLELVRDAHLKLSKQLGNKMPYGQPRTAMSFNTTLRNWDKDLPNALDVQNVSNAERDEDMHRWLKDIYLDQPAKPALNLEPFYPGWGLHSQNEIEKGLDDTTMAQMQMYGSVLSGGLAGHAWGDAWYAGAAASTSRSSENGGTIVPNNDPQRNALKSFESQSMGHLKKFILDSGHDYKKLIPAANKNLSDSQDFRHTLAMDEKADFALGFFTADLRSSPETLPRLTNLKRSETYQFQWWDVTNGIWIDAGEITTDDSGTLKTPSVPNNDRTKNWAYRILSEAMEKEEPVVETPQQEEPESFVLRINAGGTEVYHEGNVFFADNYYDTGSTLDRPQTGLEDPFRTFRYSRSQEMGYDIPLDNGEYTVRLHFAELWFGATDGGRGTSGNRVFDVRMEDRLVEDDLDIFDEVGAESILAKTYTVIVKDGSLNIDFSALAADGGTRHPVVNAIEIFGEQKLTELGENPVSEGLAGHWSLDDAIGTRATDLSGNQYHGFLVGGINFKEHAINGKIGKGLSLSREKDFVTLPDIDSSIDSQFTIAAWIHPENVSGDYQGIAGTHTSGGFMTFVYEGSLAFALQTNEGRKLLAHGTITANTWQHIAVSYDGSAMTWFINGTEVGREAHTGQVSNREMGYIGWSGWSNEYFEGGIDDVKLFKEALTKGQVRELFEEGSAIEETVNLTAKTGLDSINAENDQNSETEEVLSGFVYPNPTVGRVRLNNIPTGEKEILVSDFSGRVLMNVVTDAEQPELDFSALPDGIYTVKVLKNGLEQAFKVVKK